MNKVMSNLIKEINDEDLRTMFGVSSAVLIEKQPDAEDKLNAYLEWIMPVYIGDIIEYQGKKYVVTCVYTDNSVDICGEDATKKNIGVYMKKVEVVGRLQRIKED